VKKNSAAKGQSGFAVAVWAMCDLNVSILAVDERRDRSPQPLPQNLFSAIMAFGGRRSAAHLRPSKFDIRGSALMLC
jgi:hypothetical protein